MVHAVIRSVDRSAFARNLKDWWQRDSRGACGKKVTVAIQTLQPVSLMSYKQILHQYEAKASKARHLAAVRMSDHFGVKLSIRGLSNATIDEIEKWPQDLRKADLNFKWREIREAHRKNPKRLEISVWCEDRLSAVALCTMNDNALEVLFLEGDPRADCHLKGDRVGVVLECAANFAQGCGRFELRVRPANERLAELYVGVYGFTEERPRGGTPYFKLELKR